MALDTYANLKLAVGDWLNRADLAAAIPDFIAMAEAQLSRRLVMDGPVRNMMGRADAAIDTEFTALPGDFLGLRALRLTGARQPLAFAEPEDLVRLKILYPSQTGAPSRLAIAGATLQVWPWVEGGSYAAEMIYWKRIPALSEAAPSNWLLQLHPDAYLYGALLQSAPYLKDDARLPVWGQIFAAVIGDIVKASAIARTAPHLALSPVPSGTP
jgi:hypothetical protein